LFHALGTFARLRFAFWFVLAVELLLVELLLAALALLLKAFDYVDCTADVPIIGFVAVVAIGSDEAGGMVLSTECIWCSRQ